MLADTPDVEAALGRTLSAEEAGRVDGLISVASAAVEKFTGYRFAPGEYTVSRIVRDGRVTLPASVATVDVVRLIDRRTGVAEPLTNFTTRGSTIYGLPCGRVEVEFTVTDEVPAEIVGLAAGVVAATVSSPPVGAEQMTAGQFSVSFASTSGRVWFSASDRMVLAKYKRPAPAVVII